mgnify:CR=1 FL=1
MLKDGDRIRYVNEATNVGEILDQVNTTLPILQQILDEEGATDKKLSMIAESHINMEAQ